MKQQENPPRIEQDLENKEDIAQITVEVAKPEALTQEEQAKIEALSEETTLLAREKQEQEAEKEDGRVVSVPKQSSGKKPWFKRALLGLGFLAASVAGSAQQSKSAESMASKDPEAKTRVISKETKAKGLEFYKGGITAEGRRTPTGKLNSFESSGYTENQVYEFAEEYGLRTTSNEDFQEDLFAIPGIADSVLAEFGQTKAGTLIDGKLGARVGFAMKKLEEKNSGGGINIEPDPKTPPEMNPLPGVEKINPNLENFDELYIYFDLSPSMKANQKSLAEELRKIGRDKPVTIIGFTDKADTTFTAGGTKEAADTLESISLIDNNTELAIDALLQTLPDKQFNTENNNVIAVVTDESLQGITQEKLSSLQTLAKEKNLTFQFRMMVRGQQVIYSLDQIIDTYEENYSDKVEKNISQLEKGLEIRNKQLKEFTAELENATTNKAKKELQNRIDQTQEEIAFITQKLTDDKKVNITGYENENKK